MKALVTGAGGFIGYHLAKYLHTQGHDVIGLDIERPKYEEPTFSFEQLDLRVAGAALHTILLNFEPDQVYHLAADMGGIGYITKNHAEVLRNNTMIDLNVADTVASMPQPPRLFYSSSACVYPQHLQDERVDSASDDMAALGLAEGQAWPADPEPGYGLEKLYAEKLLEYFAKDYALPVRIARFHNVMGPLGSYKGGKEKAPAALCRKVAEAPDGGSIEVWGDGQQTRSFIYIDDLVEGIFRLMRSDYDKPVNLGSDRMVTIDELAQMAIAASGKKLTITHVPGPQGVRTRNSNNDLAKKALNGWEPKISLEEGIARTYKWIEGQIRNVR